MAQTSEFLQTREEVEDLVLTTVNAPFGRPVSATLLVAALKGSKRKFVVARADLPVCQGKDRNVEP
jgi:hypothetical protein